jgi:hypothetical protein
MGVAALALAPATVLAAPPTPSPDPAPGGSAPKPQPTPVKPKPVTRPAPVVHTTPRVTTPPKVVVTPKPVVTPAPVVHTSAPRVVHHKAHKRHVVHHAKKKHHPATTPATTAQPEPAKAPVQTAPASHVVPVVPAKDVHNTSDNTGRLLAFAALALIVLAVASASMLRFALRLAQPQRTA